MYVRHSPMPPHIADIQLITHYSSSTVPQQRTTPAAELAASVPIIVTKRAFLLQHSPSPNIAFWSTSEEFNQPVMERFLQLTPTGGRVVGCTRNKRICTREQQRVIAGPSVY